eukprot:7050656-Ditylum_brightwellii.AAC.1
MVLLDTYLLAIITHLGWRTGGREAKAAIVTVMLVIREGVYDHGGGLSRSKNCSRNRSTDETENHESIREYCLYVRT